MTLAHPKPIRAPKPAKRISRRVRIARQSAKRGQVLKADREWAEKVKVGGLCQYGRCIQLCTDAHHIYGKRAYPRLRYDMDNGIALCRVHHEEWHRAPVSRRVWFAAQYPGAWKRLQEKAKGRACRACGMERP